MNDEPKKTSGLFRFLIGFVVMLTAIGGFAALFVIRVPPENKDAMMFALGSVFGWAASVVASEYGATTIGRSVAESAVRSIERQNIANETTPTGTPDDPLSVAGAETGKPPVETTPAKP